MVDDTTLLQSADAIRLCNALVGHVARTHGIRTLTIKGVVAEQLGLRAPRAYADVDVMVDPEEFERFVAAFMKLGWHERPHLWVHDRIDQHSVTLIHDRWPTDIDVHRYFPGFLAPGPLTFDALWGHQQTFEIAGKPVIGTDETSAAAVLGLHSLRWMHNERNTNEYHYLVDQLRSRPHVGPALAALAAHTGSSQTLAPLLEAIGAPIVAGDPVDAGELRAWNRRVAHPSRTGQWITYVMASPFHRRPAELVHVLWPSRSEFLQEHPELGSSRVAAFRARARRLVRGLASAPAVFRAARRTRRRERTRETP